MKRITALLLVTALVMLFAIPPAFAVEAPDMTGIEVPAMPDEALKAIELTENETLKCLPGCGPVVKWGPCMRSSYDALKDTWHNNDELCAYLHVPVWVDIVHSLEVGLYDADGKPKCGFYLGNVSPIAAFNGGGSDSATLVIKSNDEYRMWAGANPGLMPVWCDDAGGAAWPNGEGAAEALALTCDVGPAMLPGDAPEKYEPSDGMYAVPPACVTHRSVELSVDDVDWQNEAGMYAGWFCVVVWQI